MTSLDSPIDVDWGILTKKYSSFYLYFYVSANKEKYVLGLLLNRQFFNDTYIVSFDYNTQIQNNICKVHLAFRTKEMLQVYKTYVFFHEIQGLCTIYPSK